MFFLTILKNTFLLGFFFSQTVFYSQNLVLNPSFEKFKKCPTQLGSFNKNIAHWSIPTKGSTDYFNTCSKLMGAPKNFKGSQNADFGKGYAGLFLYAPEDYREYLQAKLNVPLKEGALYNLSFYVSLADKSDTAIKEFGILLSNKAFYIPIKKELSKMHLSKLNLESKTNLEIGYSNFYKDTKDWVMVHTQFRAKGKEQYITIGNFKNNDRTRKFRVKKENQQGAYYYIDLIVLNELPSDLKSDTNLPNPKIEYELEEIHVFKSVHFSFNVSEIDCIAKKELVKIATYLRENEGLKISISGHTDAIGKEGYNQVLSNNRAKAVAEFLAGLGVSLEKIQWKGYGSSVPLKENITNKNKSKNRRVEFTITKE